MKWRDEIDDNLRKTCAIIVFVTRENLSNQAWMMYEVGSVHNATSISKTHVVPVLVDLDSDTYYKHDIVLEKYIRGALGGHQFAKSPSETNQAARELWSILDGLGSLPNEEPKNLAGALNHFQNYWREEAEKPKPGLHSNIVSRFHNEDRHFEDWLDECHNIFHWGRHAVIHGFEDRAGQLPDVENKMIASLPIGIPHPHGYGGHPAFANPRVYDAALQALGAMARAFCGIVEVQNPQDLIVCLRERRADSCYHNRIRVDGRGARVETRTREWNEEEPAIQRLLARIHEQSTDSTDRAERLNPRCVVSLIGNEIPAPPENRQNPQAMLIGAVMAKQSRVKHQVDNDLDQAGLWGMLCVSSYRGGDVFRPAHQRLLQACNDIFSAIVNTILRAEYLRPGQDDVVEEH